MAADRLLAGAGVALALAGCSIGAAPGAGPAGPTPSPSVAASATPAPSGTPPPAAAACRLPVAAGDAPLDGNPAHGAAGHGGFLQLPGGSFSADPQSLGSYDLALHKWLPVPRAWVSPDGTKFAWPEYRSAPGPATGIIHVTDAAGGGDHPIAVPSASMPISYEAAGIYVARVVPNSDAPPQGLSLLDPATGALKQVTPDGAWRWVAGGSAYAVDLDPAAAPPAQAGPGSGNRLRALDLGSGAARNVQTVPGASLQVLGEQGGNLILLVLTADRAQVRVGGATLYDQPAAQPPPASPAVVDGATIWLSGAGAAWRSIGGRPFEKIASPLQLTQVAGACRPA